MRVLIADKFEKIGIDGLKELGCEIESQPDLGADTLPGALERVDPQVLIVRGTRVSAAALKSGASLSLVIRAGAGIDTIDVSAASSLGVFVANCPGKNSIAVAELVMGLLLSCDRRIPDQVMDLRAGKWNKGEYSKARGLHGRTLGIVGLGQIGREIMARAQAFGMSVVAWSRNLTLAEATRLGIAYAETPIEVARRSDAVTINVAATSETKQLVSAEFLGAMKPGAYLINTSRGSVVDEAALADAVKTRGIRAGLDVYEGEPGGSKAQFAPAVVQLPGVYGTHHVGASTDQAQVAIAHEVINIVQQFLHSGIVPNCVNRLARSSATHVLTVRHQNRPGVLAHVFKVLAEGAINVEEVENIIYHGATATLARIHLDGRPAPEQLQAIRSGNSHIISLDLTEIEK
ncbi:MAG: D-isomer specific 2-hydroxyacid dehydrogenase, NAD-binding [Gemmatimonadetes bacterium]|jgi:D-3-phosphoglycerate dehydrogenase|nr:D-isomer specific 2-hydroxyacid dehydrogenase, NAD-binding [Gemmatimonadota bacterium]